MKIILPILKKIPYCEWIVFNGSRLHGIYTKDSDYDFTILISKGKSYYKARDYKGLKVDVCCTTYDVIKEQNLVRTNNSNAQLYILTTGLIVFDKCGDMKKLQNEARKIRNKWPEKITKKDVIEIGYFFTSYIHDLKSSAEKNIDSHYHKNYVMLNVVKFFFKLYREWMNKQIYIDKEIQRIDILFWKLYKDVNMSTNENKTSKIISMINYLVKKFNLPQTGFIYVEK